MPKTKKVTERLWKKYWPDVVPRQAYNQAIESLLSEVEKSSRIDELKRCFDNSIDMPILEHYLEKRRKELNRS